MKFIRGMVSIAVTFGVIVAGSQVANASPDTEAVVGKALAARGAETAGPARPAVEVRDATKSVTVSSAGVSHTISAKDRRNSVVRQLPDGGQVITVLRSGDTARYELGLAPGWRLEQAGPGYQVTKPGTDLVGVLEAPWAVDATGRALKTWYEASAGNELVQRVDTAGAQYPITMDPKLTYGRGIYLNMLGAEIQLTLGALIAAGGAAAYVTCKGIAKLPGGVQKIVKVICDIAPAISLKGLFDTIKSLGQIQANSCYQHRIVPNTGNWKIVGQKNCR
ncbi:hypothetical protein [Kribbella ginsengisoli]|uniref:SH3 domain-containing protein n=1 Tax=Kribbella ginsengisoli TaxID=363865 RepID=A0ABP6XX29_9ACTN